MSSLTTPTTGARRAAGRREASAAPTAVEKVDSRYLESLIGYNARRAALAVINVFLERMAVYELRPVDFSALSLIHHNPGITSRQLCGALGVLPPNLVGMINRFEKRGLVMRRPSERRPRPGPAPDRSRRDAHGAGRVHRCGT